ncbi:MULTISPECIES: nucleoside triphosphate pyrophosphatase [unclassified Paludibacterium]|uniref:Maf family protein n=1 Tax=unclassified Paludibacterium TaxID=2618429 RepID=UPI001C03E8B9|nr:nucleoside triphosphate pyrophosphatase [Paludibacterium sp. B53371]BEV71855.1 nucleoside triphosphate pyrophosphatase [Paludibacterium sp. THUN1379]
MQLVLASTSVFRREILSRLGLPFIAAAPHCDETPLPGESAPDTACRLARIKAQSLAGAYPDALIIGSDQVALLDGQQIGKPQDQEHAVRMLLNQQGRTTVFHTALALYDSASGKLQEHVDLTRVTLRPLNEAQIRHYLAQEPDALYCAGAAKSEGLGGALIERIESTDPNALIGLPLFALVSMLEQAGLPILA